MNEEFDRLFGDQDIYIVISRYKEMIEGKKSCFFDLYEFEEIIDYYIDHEDYIRALEAVRIATRQYPFSVTLRLRYAKILEEKGMTIKAIDILTEIEKVDCFNHEVHLLKGITLVKLGRQNEALSEYDKAIKLSRENRDDIIYEIAQSFLSSGKIGMAIKYLLLAHEINSGNFLVIYELASCYDRLEYWDKSIEFYRYFVDLDPFAENIWFNMGMAYSQLEKDNEALEAFDFALAINPQYLSVYCCKGDLLYNRGRYDEAIAVYRELLEHDEYNIQSLCYIGQCYEKLGRLQRALEYFKKAKAIDNCFSDAWYGMALVYKSMHKFHHSLNNLNKAIKLDGENYEYWFLRGKIYDEMNLCDEALRSYSRSIEIEPNDCEAWLAYARLYYRLRKVTSAIEVLNRAYQYTYDVSTVNYQLAAYYTSTNEYKMAAEYFEKGLALNFNEHTEYIDHLQVHFSKQDMYRIISKFQNLQ